MKNMRCSRHYVYVPLLSFLVLIQVVVLNVEVFRFWAHATANWTSRDFITSKAGSAILHETAVEGEESLLIDFGQTPGNRNPAQQNATYSREQLISGSNRTNNDHHTAPANNEIITTQRRNMLKPPLEFVHIPKTGGSAIELAGAKAGITWGLCHWQERPNAGAGCLGKDWEPYQVAKNNLDYKKVGYSWEIWHTPPSWLKNNSPYENKTLFAVVRNPYTRFISEYYCPYNGLNPVDWDTIEHDYHDPMGKPPSGNKVLKTKPTNTTKKPYTRETLNQFIMERLKYFVKWTAHYIPQADFVYDESGNQIVQHVLRFENVSKEFKELMKFYNLSVYLNETINGSNSKQRTRFTIDDLYPETIARINKVAERDFRLLGYEMLDPSLVKRSKAESSAQTQSSPTIAFLFMAKTGLNDDLWKRWFPSNDSRYSIFVHTRPSNTTVPLGPFLCPYAIPSVRTEWYELHDGMMQLLQYAMEHDANARSFVFVSATSVPLVSFQTFYDNLMWENEKSRICWHSLKGAQHVWSGTLGQLDVDEEMVRKAEMWSILSRRDVAQILAERAMLDQWNNVFLETRHKILAEEDGDQSVVGAPDECFIPTFLTMKGSELLDCPRQPSQQPGSPNCCSTYVHWDRTQTNITLQDTDVLLTDHCENHGWPCAFRSVREEGLRELQKQGYLMLRKVRHDAIVMTSENASVPIIEALLQLHEGKSMISPPTLESQNTSFVFEQVGSTSFACTAPTTENLR